MSRWEESTLTIVGGRQSAFETAALLTPHAASVELVYRHARPEFVRLDWTWVDKDMDRTRTHPGW